MKKSFLILALLLLATPFLTFADSYDGPYCFENPADFQNQTYNDDENHIRGTCKSIELTSVVSLDSSLQNDYLLAQHNPIDLLCERDCETTKRSEIIQPTTATLTFSNQDITREFQGYDYSSGESKSLGLIYDDTVAVLDKKYVLDYISSVYKQFGKKLDYNKLPQIVLMDQNEMKKVDKGSVGYSYDELLALFKGNDPLYVEKGLIGDNSSPSIYSFNYSNFGKHIASLKGSLSEYRYIDLDKTKLPSVDIKAISSGRGRIVYTVPITSPIKSAKNYWIFTEKNEKIVLAWQKSEYILDNGTTKVDTNTNIKVNSSPSSNNSTNIVSSSTSNVLNTLPAEQPAEQKKGFFSRLLDFILSWLSWFK